MKQALFLMIAALAVEVFGQTNEWDLVEKYKLPLHGYLTSASSKQRAVKQSKKRSDVSGDTYADERVSFTFVITETNILFRVENRADETARLLWDEASYIDAEASSHHVIHGATKLVDRQQSQLPSALAAGAKLEDNLFPSDYVSWRNNQWKFSPLFSGAAAVGQTFRLLLPVEFEGQIFDYVFAFVVRPEQVAAKQLQALGQLTVGMTRERVEALVGEPDGHEASVREGRNVEIWQYFSYKPGFTKITFTDGIVTNINRKP